MPPWPYAIMHLGKCIENRSWRTNYKGPLLIHASKNWDRTGYNFIRNKLRLSCPPKGDHVFGALVGKTEILDCVSWIMGPEHVKWFFGPYGFLLGKSKALERPVPYLGKLGLFDVPEELIP